MLDLRRSARGIETAFAQIAADAMGLPFATFTVRHGSTTDVHEGFGTYHSRALVMGGSAVLDGAKNLLAAIRAAGAAQLGCALEDAVVGDARIEAKDGRWLGFAEIAEQAAKSGVVISAQGTFASSKRTYSYGAHAAHVAVDPRTGHVQVVDYLAIEDVGRAVNPGIVHGQAIGAAVQGLGGVFLDHLIYDADAQLLNASLADYLLPLATDFPNVRAVTLELRPSLLESAWRQRRRRRRHRGGRCDRRQCGSSGACKLRRRAEGNAAESALHLAPHRTGKGARRGLVGCRAKLSRPTRLP